MAGALAGSLSHFGTEETMGVEGEHQTTLRGFVGVCGNRLDGALSALAEGL